MNILAFLNNKKVQNILLVIAILFAIWMLWTSNKNLKKDNQRLVSNMETLGADLKYIRIQNGTLAAQSGVLELRLKELQTLFPKQSKSIQDLGVNPSRVQQLSTTVIESQKQIVTTLRDSVIHDTVHVRVFSYKDQWYTIKGQAIGDTQQVQIQNTDTLVQVVYKGQRVKPWLWIFSPRKLEQRVSVSNPNANIKYAQVIQIQKR
jgi:cell division protein FtsL